MKSPTQTITRNELFWLTGAIVIACILRLSFPLRMAIEHFDEGVYASNFWFDADDGYSYPARYLYAPPLLPTAIEWTMTIASLCGLKPTGFIPIIPSLIAGIAMIPSLWWVCRTWFGPIAGLVTGWLAAVSDFHASYSRAALTDVPVCLFILWGVYFAWRALISAASESSDVVARKSSKITNPPFPWKDVALAGGFTGLAWWTKYNGWLPLAIGITAAFLWQILARTTERRFAAVFRCWLMISIVAGLVWLPVPWGLQKHGGYAQVAANHRQYVVPIQDWGQSAVSQLYNMGLYESTFDVFWQSLSGHISRRPPLHSEFLRMYWRSFGNVPAIPMRQFGSWRFRTQILRDSINSLILPLLVPVLLLIASLFVCLQSLRLSRDTRSLLANCILIAWFGGMTVATPFYCPYPRLILPWLCSTWICVGVFAQRWFDREAELHTAGLARIRSVAIKAIAFTFVAATLIRLVTGTYQAWSDRSGTQVVARQFAASVKKETATLGYPENEAIVYVLGDPAIVFGMRSEGLPAVLPAQGLGFMERPIVRPTYVAFPPNSDAVTTEEREELSSWRFERIDGLGANPSHLVLMDNSKATTWAGTGLGSRSFETKLYRLIK
jgi:dolichyl-phosphate-mannose-protein mannosyltransferase